ncbi:hypothetical protein [Mucilaginibacter glaciei]|uniref:Uncharacterized protein n=1 Tax=Mucilaginibacter glaciei TaxID=2772109 RepID=A0A926NU87_9SPHI|nr:hypothetical protein [Mucilaginibacter glaciei]MBD1394820.1 hypothetical protein [Mucilaginibacter glaciei]
MENTYLSQPTTTTFSTGVVANNASTLSTTQKQFAGDNRTSVSTTSATHQPHIFKTVVDMVGEGLKQNFLGPNIDMEFLTLTLRSFASTSARAIQQFVKPLTKKREVENPCHQLNQPCF